jgi:glycosyltransferase involved in cell wall biosynthesis
LNTLVSIGIPTYRRPELLRATLRRISEQTYADLEIIVSDNASGDATRDIVESIAAGDSRIRYICQRENIGANGNFRFVLEQAKGELFAWVADDDDCAPTFIERLATTMDEHRELALVMSDLHLVDRAHPERDKTIELDQIRVEDCLRAWERIRRLFFRYPTSNVFFAIYGLYRTEIVRAARFDFASRWKGLLFGGEVPFLAQIASHGMIGSIAEPLKTYVVHGESAYAREMITLGRFDELVRHSELRAEITATALRAPLPIGERLRLATYPWRSYGRRVASYFRRSNSAST